MTFLYVNFDPGADAGYVRFKEGVVDGSSEVASGLIVDWDIEDEPLGLEVLYVRRRLPEGDAETFLKGLAEGWLASRALLRDAAE